MKIAVYHNLISGGNKRSIYEKVRGFKSYGHAVDVYNLSISNEVFFSLEGLADRIFTFKVPLFRWHGILKVFNPIGQILQLAPLWFVNKSIAKAINKGDYDMVWVANCFVTQHPLVLPFLKKPCLLYTTEHYRPYYDKVLWKRWDQASSANKFLLRLYRAYQWLSLFMVSLADRLSIRRAPNVLVDSHFIKECILRFYDVGARVLYLGIDLEKFCPQKIEKENLILSVGGMSPLKGHDLVLDSLKHIPREIRPKLIILADRVDNSTEYNRYHDFAKVNDIQLEIYKDPGDVKIVEWYNRAKITVCGNILEPFGLVPLESMACETPVIAVNEGGFRETVIHEKTGLSVERNAEAMGHAIQRLLNDDVLRNELGKKGRQLVEEKFSLQIFWSNIEKQIQSVASNNKLNYEI